MTKLLVCPTGIKNYKKLIHSKVDSFIVGIKNYCVFLDFEVSIDELKKIVKLTDKEVFVAINKPLYNKDLPIIINILKELSKINIKGVLFEDISIVNINNELDLNLNLVWNQIHLPTNYYTCNYWYDKGIKYGYLSTELRLQDYIDIKKNTDMQLMVYTYGYLPMFESPRTLVTNYLTYIKRKNMENAYIYEKERNKYYPIYEKNNESYVLDDILNGIKEVQTLKENDIDYIVLNGLMHKDKDFDLVVDCYIKALNGNTNIEELVKILNNNNTGFLYKETIYKVKL